MRKKIIGAITCVIWLFGFALGAYGMDATSLAMMGGRLNADQAAALEEKSEQDPSDIATRTKLLGYYFGKQYSDKTARTARHGHILWLIKNAPESDVMALPYAGLNQMIEPDAYTQAKKAWLDQLESQPDNLKLLEHSAKFFLQHEREMAKKSLEKARALDPNNPKWPAALGQLHSLDLIGISGKAKRVEVAGKSLEQLEIAYELATEQARDPLLKRLAEAAFAAKDFEKAKKYAMEMLGQNRDDWNTGNNVHHGNIILGRIAITQNDVKEAKRRLLEAGKTSGSPQLNSFGPDMTLANELLKLGEKEVVLKYFDLCSKFWDSGKDRLEQWSATVKAGEEPDFGRSLRP